MICRPFKSVGRGFNLPGLPGELTVVIAQSLGGLSANHTGAQGHSSVLSTWLQPSAKWQLTLWLTIPCQKWSDFHFKTDLILRSTPRPRKRVELERRKTSGFRGREGRPLLPAWQAEEGNAGRKGRMMMNRLHVREWIRVSKGPWERWAVYWSLN